MTKIKLCGLSREADILCANAVKADYIGFMFYEKSKRYVSFETAKQLRSLLDERILAVGVFVDAPVQTILRPVEERLIDVVQLHGNEDEETVKLIAEKAAVPVIKAFRVETETDLETAMHTCASYPLLDHGAGGTGTTFDWSLVRETKRHFFLAGGLTPENVGKAVRTLHPYAVDVSSGIETDGRKDAEKIRRFTEEVRKADDE